MNCPYTSRCPRCGQHKSQDSEYCPVCTIRIRHNPELRKEEECKIKETLTAQEEKQW